MNKFERWFLERLFKRMFKQGFYHADNIADVYRMIRVTAETEFYEDNTVTLNSNLRELFELSLRKPMK